MAAPLQRASGDAESHLPTFEIKLDREPDRPVVAHVIGPIDLLTAPALRLCVDDNIAGDNGLVLDFSQVDFLAASGLTVLCDTEYKAGREHLAWALVASTRPVIRPLDLMGLRAQLPTYDTVSRAVAAVSKTLAACT